MAESESDPLAVDSDCIHDVSVPEIPYINLYTDGEGGGSDTEREDAERENEREIARRTRDGEDEGSPAGRTSSSAVIRSPQTTTRKKRDGSVIPSMELDRETRRSRHAHDDGGVSDDDARERGQSPSERPGRKGRHFDDRRDERASRRRGTNNKSGVQRREARERRIQAEAAMSLAQVTDDEGVLDPDALMRLCGASCCEEYQISGVENALQNLPIKNPTKQNPRAIITKYQGGDLLVYQLVGQGSRGQMNEKAKFAFVFWYGVVVFFNYTTEEESQFLQSIREFEKDPDLSLLDHGEEMEYGHGEVFRLNNDVITLMGDSHLQKLSVAFAVAQCVKLNIFEERVDTVIENNKHLALRLSQTGEIALSHKELAMKMGALFMERNNINLHNSDILETPEFFWDEDQYKFIYTRLKQYLELDQRKERLNKRLELLGELFRMVHQQMQSQRQAQVLALSEASHEYQPPHEHAQHEHQEPVRQQHSSDAATNSFPMKSLIGLGLGVGLGLGLGLGIGLVLKRH